jgi:hypothetical protein
MLKNLLITIFAVFVLSGIGLYCYEQWQLASKKVILALVFFFPFYLYYQIFFKYQGKNQRWVLRLNSIGLIGLAGALIFAQVLERWT